jgi:predicted transcriptional regulator
MSKREGFTIVPNHIVGDRRLTERQRVVLEALMSFRAKKTGHVFGKLDQIADICGLAPTTVSEALNQLARAGYIRIKRNRRGCNDYWFLFDFHDWSCPIGEQEVTESVKPRTQDFTESVKPRTQDFTESVKPRSGIEDQDFTESVKPRSGIEDQDFTESSLRLHGIRETPTDPSTDPLYFSKKKKVDGGVGEGGPKPPTDSDATPEPSGREVAFASMREMTGTPEPPPPPPQKLQPIAPSGTLAPIGDIARGLLRKAQP